MRLKRRMTSLKNERLEVNSSSRFLIEDFIVTVKYF